MPSETTSLLARPNPAAESRSEQVLRILPLATSIAVGAVVVAVLAGWILGVRTLQSIVPGYVTMKVNTAAGLGLLSVAVALIASSRSSDAARFTRVVGKAAAAVVALLGIATLAEYALNRNLGIDELLMAATADTALTSTPGRMAAVTAVALLLLGCSLMLVGVRTSRGDSPTQWLAITSGGIGMSSLLAYAYQLVPVHGVGQGIQIAVHTAVAVVLLSIGVLACEPECRWMRVLTSNRAGGVMARRMMPVAFLVPLMLGAARATHIALLGSSLSGESGLLAVFTMFAFGIVIWASARRLEDIDAKWQESEKEKSRVMGDEKAARVLAATEQVARAASDQARELIERQADELSYANADLARAKGEADDARAVAETALREQAALLEAIPEVVLVLDRQGTYLSVPGSTHLLVGRAEEMLGHRMGEFLPAELTARCIAAINAVLDSGNNVELEYDVDIRGRRVAFAAIVSRLNAESVLWIAHDVTQRNSAEERLLQAQKLEAVGRLAGGIAHDFNNMLTVITSYASMILRTLSEGDEVRADLLEIKSAADRAAQLTSQLLAFSRKQTLEATPMDVNETLLGVEQMFRRVLPEHLELSLELSPGLGLVLADQGQIEQVVMNLVLNSRDAMPDGGSLVIRTSSVLVDSQTQWVPPQVPHGRHVLLSVTDDGTGMPKAVLDHIFEPFFTTKDVGSGTGLGLATAHGVITQSNGHITVSSEPGEGTTVRILLPEVASARPAPKVTPVHAPSSSVTSGIVLLVEDEPLVRSVAERILQRCGYSVLVASNGKEGVALFEQRARDVTLVLSDMIMPEMNGPELARRIRDIRPDVPILFMSGYTDEAVLQRGLADGPFLLLHKPFTPDALVNRVREALHAQPLPDDVLVGANR